MCERETSRLLRLDEECRHVAVFLNLGLMHPIPKLCPDCQTLVEEMRKWVFENTDLFYTLDREIENRLPQRFVHDLWPVLFNTVVQDELNEGRLFALFTCLTRAGMIWRAKRTSVREISEIQRELQDWLKARLPTYDWKLFSHFIRQMRATTLLGWVWNLLGER